MPRTRTIPSAPSARREAAAGILTNGAHPSTTRATIAKNAVATVSVAGLVGLLPRCCGAHAAIENSVIAMTQWASIAVPMWWVLLAPCDKKAASPIVRTTPPRTSMNVAEVGRYRRGASPPMTRVKKIRSSMRYERLTMIDSGGPLRPTAGRKNTAAKTELALNPAMTGSGAQI